MNTSVNQALSHGRREEDVPRIVIPGIDTSLAAMNIIHAPQLGTDLSQYITLFRTVDRGTRHNHFFELIMRHPNTSAEVLQLLFFETKSVDKSGIILTTLLSRYPDDIKILAFVLRHGYDHFEKTRIYEILERILMHPQIDIATLVSLLEPIATDYVLCGGMFEKVNEKIFSFPFESIIMTFEELIERAVQRDNQSKYLVRDSECDSNWGDELLNIYDIIRRHGGIDIQEIERLREKCPETFEVHRQLTALLQGHRDTWNDLQQLSGS